MGTTPAKKDLGKLVLAVLVAVGSMSCAVRHEGAGRNLTGGSSDVPQQSVNVQAAQDSFATGVAAENHGQWNAACRAFQSTDQFYSSAGGHQRERGEALLRWADAELQCGRIREARLPLATALQLARANNDLRALALSLNAEGVLLTYAGQSEAANAALLQARDLAESLHQPELTAAVMNNLGNLDRSSGDMDAAAREYQAAADLLKGDIAPSLAARLAVNAADVASIRHSVDAMEQVRRAMVVVAAEPPTHAKAMDLLTLGRSAVRLATLGQGNNRPASEPVGAIPDGRKPLSSGAETRAFNPRNPLPTLAEEAFGAALEVGRSNADSIVTSNALGEQGHLRELAHDDAAALQLTHKAQFAAAAAGPFALYRWQWQAGRILAHQGDMEGALLAYRNAAASVAPIRSDLILGYGNLRDGTSHSTFRNLVGPLFLELAGLILRKSATLSGPEAQAALLEARQTVEQLKSSEIQDYFKDDCAVTARTVARDIGTLDSHTAVIYFIPQADHLEILVQCSDGITRHTSPVGSDALSETVHLYREELEDRTQYAYLNESRRLYDWLITPLLEHFRVRKIDTLIFVPDGALLSVPMSSLFDGKDYLIEQFAIAMTPGLTLMDPRPIPRGDGHMLAGGLSLSRSGFSALPNVPAELAQVAGIYGGSPLLDQTFLGSRLQSEIQSYPFTIIHLASHAEFLGQSSKSFLLTYDGRLSLDDLQRLIAPTAVPSHGRLRPIELLTLSACQTATGDDRAALGLAGVALKAGARSVLATLWSVNDAAQGALVADVYGRLRDDPALSKAKALQQAQRKLLKRYPHAYYWSAQILIGNWL